MSALFWIFGLGGMAVAFPFLFHLIRRTPKGKTEFSSLMFLKPSPPTLTRRSRLENLMLLLLRAAAICLIAFAFMRPFLRSADSFENLDAANRRVAILLDTSASMQRGDLWDQALQRIDEVLAGTESGDDVALFAFDSRVRTVFPFDGPTAVSEKRTLASKRSDLKLAVKSVEPTFARSDLGNALVTVADQLDAWKDSQNQGESQGPAKLQMVVISDMQATSRTEALQNYQWPTNVYVKFLPIEPKESTNATVQLLEQIEEDEPTVRVRVSNANESGNDQFDVRWFKGAEEISKTPMTYYVPEGTSRVLKISPGETMGADQFVLFGDEDEFDNVFHVVPTQQQKVSIAYYGDAELNDPGKTLFYFQRAFVESATRQVSVQAIKKSSEIKLGSLDDLALVVVAGVVSGSQKTEIEQFVKDGGTALVLLSNSDMASQFQDQTGAEIKFDSDNPGENDYQMLAEIKFAHPWLSTFSNAKFNDFTKIRFWKYQPVDLSAGDIDVLGWFDNHDPAIWYRPIDNGGIYTMSSDWSPEQSQLALSTKFVPLMNRLLDLANDLPQLEQSLKVGDAIEFPVADSERILQKPDGTQESIEANQTQFAETDVPGIYRLESNLESSEPMLFAVNVDRAESESAMLPVEQIEVFEVKVGEQETASSELSQLREKKDLEIENQQKFWKWLIVGAILVLMGETWLAGRTQSQLVAAQNLETLSGETV